MNHIEVNGLSKSYHIAKREEGFLGAVKHLVSPQYEVKPGGKGYHFFDKKKGKAWHFSAQTERENLRRSKCLQGS